MTRIKPEADLRRLGVEFFYTTPELARLFGRTRQWAQMNITRETWRDRKGRPIKPERDERGRYRWTPDQVKEIAASCYKNRTVTMPELKSIVRQVLRDTSHLSGKYPTEEPAP